MLDIATNLERVRERLAGAAARAGRRADDVLLIGVSKTVDVARIRAAVAAGVTALGENRVQEAKTLDAVGKLAHVRVRGLMVIPPEVERADDARPWFRRLRELAERHGLRELSMGMSGDFEVAVEEGATMVRVGTAVFGPRPPRPA